jgi:hypothetical protein
MIVYGVSSVKVGAVAEGVCMHILTWFVAKFIVVLLQFNLSGRCMGSYFVQFTPICKISVVCPYYNGFRGASEEM